MAEPITKWSDPRLREAFVGWLWTFYYRAFPVKPPPGKGAKENPLTMEDMEPLFTMLRRIRYRGDS